MEEEKKSENFGSRLVEITGKMFDTLVLGILFLICSIPIFTIGTSMTALAYAYRKTVKEQKGYLVRNFFHGFASNFKEATPIWLVDALLLFVLFLNVRYTFLSKGSNGMLFLFILYSILSGVVLMGTITMFDALSRFNMSRKKCFTFGFAFSLAHLASSMVLLLGILCLAVISWRVPALVPFLPAILVWMTDLVYGPSMKKCVVEEPNSTERTA